MSTDFEFSKGYSVSNKQLVLPVFTAVRYVKAIQAYKAKLLYKTTVQQSCSQTKLSTLISAALLSVNGSLVRKN
jgi:hypothetical protein